MQFDVALVREHGVEFAVVVVNSSATGSDHARRQAMASFGAVFPGVPIVLMTRDGRGRPTFWGRQDIVGFLARVPVQALPWRRCTLP